MKDKNKFILAIGAHPDDIELGCGGILSRHISLGDEVLALIMSAGECGHDSTYNRVDEAHRSLSSLGVNNIFCFDFNDTFLEYQINHLIYSIEMTIANHISNEHLYRVYTMCRSDRHQDHRAVHDASIVACRNARQILCYETPSTWMSFHPNLYIDITQQEIEKKIQALKEHRSQQHRGYMQAEQIHSVARFRGQQVGCELSEAFVIHKMVV